MASQSSKTSPKKPKLVRDSFTIPKNEFAAIEQLKDRAIALGTSVKKSELLRAGLMSLQGLTDAAYKAALAAVPTLKTGRPTAAAKTAPAKAAGTAVAKPVAKVASKSAGQSAAKPANPPAAKKAVAKSPAAKSAPRAAAGRSAAAKKAG